MKCPKCGGDIAPGGAWYQITGYDQPRKGGGTNAVALREETGKVICSLCIARLKAGISAEQETLV